MVSSVQRYGQYFPKATRRGVGEREREREVGGEGKKDRQTGGNGSLWERKVLWLVASSLAFESIGYLDRYEENLTKL